MSDSSSHWITAPDKYKEFTLYDVKAQPGEVVELPEDARLVVHEDAGVLYFACFLWLMSEVDGTNARYSILFHGTGFGGALRECRHTYWGEDGYTFYMPLDVIAAAMSSLKKWFDAS